MLGGARLIEEVNTAAVSNLLVPVARNVSLDHRLCRRRGWRQQKHLLPTRIRKHHPNHLLYACLFVLSLLLLLLVACCSSSRPLPRSVDACQPILLLLLFLLLLLLLPPPPETPP